MSYLSRWSLLVSLGMIVSTTVYATNGMFLIAPGTKSRGMGGASMTLSHDTLTSSINPATMVHIEGNRFDIGGDIFIPTAEATLGQEGTPQRITQDSEPQHMTVTDGVYIMPNMGASWNMGDFAYGFTMVGVGGGGSFYDTNLYNVQSGADIEKDLGVSLIVMQINPTVAMKLSDTHSIGATLVLGMQVFKAFGLDQFNQFTATQSGTGQLSNQGSEITYGYGLRLGWLGNYMDNKLTVGASYSSEVNMKRFEDYDELFAEGGDFDTPGNFGVGISYNFGDKLIAAFDVHYVMYEDVAAVSNLGPNTSGTAFPVDRATNALGLPEGLGFGWENQTVYKLGLAYKYSDLWTLRGGWNYGKSPIDESREILFNITAPATVQHHMTVGATYQYSKAVELTGSYVHAFEYTQAGPTFIGSTGEIGMSQDSLGMTFSMKF